MSPVVDTTNGITDGGPVYVRELTTPDTSNEQNLVTIVQIIVTNGRKDTKGEG